MSKKKKILNIFIIVLLSVVISVGIATDIYYSNQVEDMLENAEQSKKIDKLNQKWETIQLDRKTDCIFCGTIFFVVFVIVLNIGPEKKKDLGVTQKEAMCFAAELQQAYCQQGIYVPPIEGETDEVFITSLDVPKLLEAKFVDNKVIFRWENVQFAEGYSIWRRMGNQRWNRIGRVKGDSCEYVDYNIDSKSYYSYTVKAYAFCDGERIVSKKDPLGITVEIVQGNIPEMPNIYRETDVNGQDYITWNEIPKVNEYRILRKVKGGEWEMIAALDSVMPRKFHDMNKEENQRYYYTVCACKKIENQEILSDYDEDGIKL